VLLLFDCWKERPTTNQAGQHALVQTVKLWINKAKDRLGQGDYWAIRGQGKRQYRAGRCASSTASQPGGPRTVRPIPLGRLLPAPTQLLVNIADSREASWLLARREFREAREEVPDDPVRGDRVEGVAVPPLVIADPFLTAFAGVGSQVEKDRRGAIMECQNLKRLIWRKPSPIL
jgi:hypothetical protein